MKALKIGKTGSLFLMTKCSFGFWGCIKTGINILNFDIQYIKIDINILGDGDFAFGRFNTKTKY
jgi:hypothetical protein